MYYILGGSGLLGKSIKKILKNCNYKIISRSKKKNSIKTNIFNDNLYFRNVKKENWLNKFNDNDCLILLSNFGKISHYQKYNNKIINFEKKIFFILKNINKKTRIIFFSSDMVYNGKKTLYKDNSKAKPLNRYGCSKKKIEDYIVNNFSNYLILRLCKVYSLNKKNKSLVSELYSEIKKKNKIYLFQDQYVHYMELNEFIIKFSKIIKSPKLVGIFNFPGSLFTSRYKMALSIFPKYKRYFVPIKLYSKFKYLPKIIKMKTNLFFL